MERGGKKSATIPEEEKEDEPSLLPMTPESKQLAADGRRAIYVDPPAWQLANYIT